MQPMANIALRAARKASDYLTVAFGRPDSFEVTSKARNDFVSNVDRTAESIIIEQIRETYPNHGIIAEESGLHEANSEFTWVIDPLDGTSSFIKKSDQFTVNIALVENFETVFGVIYVPAMDLMYYTDHNQHSIKVVDFSSLGGKKSQISVSGKKDSLMGLKENVIVGRLVPAGTGLTKIGWDKAAQQEDNIRLEELKKAEEETAQTAE